MTAAISNLSRKFIASSYLFNYPASLAVERIKQNASQG
ncbi:hypothetical protein AC78_2545 [Escherichia coli 7-233-03_S4_C1]|nr:hypothetical protein AC78_2545 [Escherichia coli 7-233-03_S4_C1]KEN54712.1 hypothetical protein AD35_2551 [Escherichia coli 7-233-03_S4_C3]